MRLLTFIQLAEENPDMSFRMLLSELDITEEMGEPFIIEGKI